MARTILVTGFEPFGGETVNASWEATKQIEGRRHGDNCDRASAALLLPACEKSSMRSDAWPDGLLMTGQAARRAVVCVERFAHNLDDAAAPDNDGDLRRAIRISRAAPEWLEARVPASVIATAIKQEDFPRGCRGARERSSATTSFLERSNISMGKVRRSRPSSCICR